MLKRHLVNCACTFHASLHPEQWRKLDRWDGDQKSTDSTIKKERNKRGCNTKATGNTPNGFRIVFE